MCTLKINKHKWGGNGRANKWGLICESHSKLEKRAIRVSCGIGRSWRRTATPSHVGYGNKFHSSRWPCDKHDITWKKNTSGSDQFPSLWNLQIFHCWGLSRYKSINNLDTKIWSSRLLRRQIAYPPPRPPTPPPQIKQWILMHLLVGRDKNVLLILCHIYQLITYLLFQFFPSLQPSCLRTLHLWQGDKKVSIQGW